MPPFTTELAAARAAQEPWSQRTVRDRLRHVRALRALLVNRTNDICAAIHADIGRPTVEVLGSELLTTAAALKYLENRSAKFLAPRRVSWWDQPTWLMGCRDVIHHRPWGVVGILGTWNYPVYLNVIQIAQAFVAGNAVLWKPSENVPRTTELTQTLFRDAGFPPGLLQVLPATREAGPQLAETAVDHVVFTGSEVIGRKLASRLGERLIPSTLELSGCDAMFVLPDADITMAARAAWFGLTLNRGQTCIAVRRIFVQREKLDAFAGALGPLVRAEPMSLVLWSQKAQAERLIEEATKRGAVVLPFPLAAASGLLGAGGKPTPPTPLPEGKGEKADSGRVAEGVGSAAFLRPTFLLNVPADAAICRESCFAPVAAVIAFGTVEEALAMAKQSPFGLAASIFTADTAKARELAALIPAGHVSINDVLAPTGHPATPFGGRGASGWGVTQGAEGLLAMTTPQAVTVRNGTFRPHFDEAASPDPATEDLLRGLLKWTHARGWGAKLKGLWQMVRGARKKK
jgi:acyl-CoA reductase-like NAD-dependent aldehyde dehydrogenase